MVRGRPPKKPVRIDSEGMKYWKCTKCKNVKSEFNFSEHPKTSNGLNSWCKECVNEHQAARYRMKKKDEELKEQYIQDLEARVRELESLSTEEEKHAQPGE